jgi:CheY-like chemotaxis protein
MDITNRKHILLVEDNHLNLRIMSRLLQGMGINITEAKTSQEAIKYAIEEDFSMIFMCIFMPEITGFETTKKIRELSKINKDIPIIAVSSNGYNSVTDKMIECGISDVISKPLKEDEVKDLFHKYIVEETIVSTPASMNYTMFDVVEFESFYNDEVLQKEIASTFINEKESDLDRINKAFDSNDIEKIYDALHYMKGSFTYLKANNILKLTQQILDLLIAKKLGDVLLLRETFYQNYDVLFNELCFYINST